ncbi:MAG: hypothetical protein WD042_10485 [Phycisphaeraceae bacterium]
MGKAGTTRKRSNKKPGEHPASADVALPPPPPPPAGRASSLLDTRVIYCGDCLEQLKNLPAACVDLIYIDPPFNSNHNYDPRRFWGQTREKRASGGEDRHASTQAYIDYMRPRCVDQGTERNEGAI